MFSVSRLPLGEKVIIKKVILVLVYAIDFNVWVGRRKKGDIKRDVNKMIRSEALSTSGFYITGHTKTGTYKHIFCSRNMFPGGLQGGSKEPVGRHVSKRVRGDKMIVKSERICVS